MKILMLRSQTKAFGRLQAGVAYDLSPWSQKDGPVAKMLAQTPKVAKKLSDAEFKAHLKKSAQDGAQTLAPPAPADKASDDKAAGGKQ